MGTRDPRIDAYLAKSPAFAQPILTQLREIVHDACPDVVETMKWSVPFFEYQGPLCNMAAFKEHCAFGFWKQALVMEGMDVPAEAAAGSFGRIAALGDLPPTRELTRLVKKAAALNADGVKPPARTKTAVPKAPVVVPDYFAAALDRNDAARAHFDGFSPSHRREYVEWITEAKSEATRERRMAQAMEWLAEGKSRHWKYQNC